MSYAGYAGRRTLEVKKEVALWPDRTNVRESERIQLSSDAQIR
jgi:hypothetical protein